MEFLLNYLILQIQAQTDTRKITPFIVWVQNLFTRLNIFILTEKNTTIKMIKYLLMEKINGLLFQQIPLIPQPSKK